DAHAVALVRGFELHPPLTRLVLLKRSHRSEQVERTAIAKQREVAGVQPHHHVTTTAEDGCDALPVRIPAVPQNHVARANRQARGTLPSGSLRDLQRSG